MFDANAKNYNLPSGSLGIEAGMGLPASSKIGADVNVSFSNFHSGRWKDNNEAYDKLLFMGNIVNSSFEPFYFKNAGEKVANDMAYYKSIGEEDPVSLALEDLPDVKMLSKFKTNDNKLIPFSNSIARNEREKRNTMLCVMTVSDAVRYALNKKIESFVTDPQGNHVYNKSGSPVKIEYDRNYLYRKPHHISEMTYLNSDGARYVYGIPAYNVCQKEVSFNVGNSNTDCSSGNVSYEKGKDNSLNNDKGIDNYYSSNQLPPYAYSYLLTAVLSSDYVDVTGNGPSDDDPGSYTKFNYTKTQDSYKWRTPYSGANHNEGFKTDKDDDKGSYVYGEKEIWYLYSVETKDYIAEFILSDRKDGLGVADENGGAGNGKLKKLDKIVLYSRSDKINSIKNGIPAKPLKTVYFEYTYELCPGVPNSTDNGGKLTLKKIWFAYGENTKGRQNPYIFEYNGFNPSYDARAYDRWGNYKFNCCNSDCAGNSDFPYVAQDNREQADKWASAWSLTDIGLPSGGKIKITYEADDYAYVQDKQAMQMFRITGMGSSPEKDDNNKVNLYDGDKNNLYVYFNLSHSVANADEFKKNYIDGTGRVYFNFFVDLTNKNDFEFISGYAETDGFGYNADKNYGWIKLKEVSIGDRTDGNKKVNPVSKAAWQFLRINLPQLVYPSMDMNKPVEQAFKTLAGYVEDIKTMFRGFNRNLKSKNYAKKVDLAKSWVRLLNHDKKKIGGGVRVKKIEFYDNWNEMSGEFTSKYGQEYDYTFDERQEDGSLKTVSSGVASYEPMIGGDENPFRTPVLYQEKAALGPNNDFYVETPFGESFFPSPVVGYRKVTVRNLQNEDIKRHATGKVVHEFYTAYDFPVITKQTPIDAIIKRPSSVKRFFGIQTKEYATASQGYAVELNDMHGKPKSVFTFAEDNDTPVSGIEYYYKVDNGNTLHKHLNNKVIVLNKDGTFKDGVTAGEDIDVVFDMREKEEKNYVQGTMLNMDAMLLAFIPAVIPVIFPQYSATHNRLRTSVVTKVINRYGILDRIVAYENGASIETANLAFDPETGETLLTKTQNEYGDYIYNMTYPAHWCYSGMGNAYKNYGTYLKDINVSGGTANNAIAAAFMNKGDEVRLTSSGFNRKLWVLDVKGSLVSLIDNKGISPPGGKYDIKVLRSGRRNQQSESVGNTVMLSNPLDFKTNSFTGYSGVLSSGTVQYSDKWQMLYGMLSNTNNNEPVKICNLDQNGKNIVELLNLLLTDNGLITGKGNKTDICMYKNIMGILPDNTCTCEAFYSSSVNDNAESPYKNSVCIKFNIQDNCGMACSDAQLISLVPKPDFTVNSFDNINHFEDEVILAGTNASNIPSPYSFYITAVMNDGSKVLMLVKHHACWGISGECRDALNIFCPVIAQDEIVNPYLTGIRGIWRIKDTYVYYDKTDNNYSRTQSLINNDYNTTNTQTDGVFADDIPFWSPDNGKDWQCPLIFDNDNPWTLKNEVTKYSPSGFELENKDALGIFSSALYGYSNKLPVAAAQNAMHSQIAYDGFEDYDNFLTGDNCYIKDHWSFRSAGGVNSSVTDKTAHSGVKSLSLANGKISAERSLLTSDFINETNDFISIYKIKPQDIISMFSPPPGEYIISYWVKADNFQNNYEYVTVEEDGNNLSLMPQGNDIVVEGWKRVERKFTLAKGQKIKVTLNNPGITEIYFDDIRIYPLNANIRTFAYNPLSLDLMAEMNENNFATFYEYDEESNLVRVKKETEKGIYTVKETRQNVYKK